MRLKTILSGSAILFATMSVATPASAQLGDIIDGIGFGKEKEPIEYRERAPLVVPPSYTLRPPEEKAPGDRVANWPKDPDVARAKAKAEDDRRPRATSNETGGPKLSVDELRAGRVAGANVGGPDQYDRAKPNSYGWMNPDVIQEQGRSFVGLTQDKPLRPGEEPKRRFLTDPPKGVRAAAAGAPVVATRDKAGPSLDDESSPYSFINPKKQED